MDLNVEDGGQHAEARPFSLSLSLFFPFFASLFHFVSTFSSMKEEQREKESGLYVKEDREIRGLGFQNATRVVLNSSRSRAGLLLSLRRRDPPRIPRRVHVSGLTRG